MIVEELIGRLSLQTKGIDKAKQATKALQEFRKALQGLAGASRTNFDGPARIAKSIREARKEAERLAQSQKRMGSGGDFGRADAGARKHLSTVQKLRAAYFDTAKAAAQLGKRPSGGSWIEGELRSLREYKRLQQQIGREAGRRSMSRRDIGRQQDTYRYGGRHDGVGLRNPTPGAVDVRGLLDKGFDSATTMPQVQAQMRMRKESEADIERATKLATKLSGDVKQFTAAEHMQAIYGSLSVFGDMDTALKAAPGLAKANALIEGLSDQFTRLKPFKGGTGTKDFARVFDLMGVTNDQKKMSDLSEAMVKVLEQSSGDIVPSDMLQALKMAKSARYGFNADFLQNYLSGIIGDAKVKTGGAGGAGVGLMSAFTNFHDLGGPAWTIANMERLGLIEDPSKLGRNKKGKVKDKGTAQIVNKALYRDNPQQWFVKELLPRIEKAKGKLTGNDQEDAGKVLDIVGQVAGNRNAKDQAASAILQRDERERDANLTRKMPGISALPELDKAPVGVLQQFTAGVTELFVALAAPAVTPALAAMKSMGDMARGVANFQRENPDAAPIVSGTAGVVGGATATGAAVVGKRMLGRLFGLGGTTPGGGSAPATTPIEPPSPTTPTTPRIPGGPQASALDVAARGAARAAAAAAFPITAGLTKGDQNSLVKRLGAYAQEQERAKQGPAPATAGAPTAPTTTPNAVAAAAAVPNAGAVQARLSEIQSSTTAAAEKMKDALEFTAKPTVDASGIDAAIAKAQQLKALLDGAKASASGAGSGLGGASIAKGSNTFTSPGATAP